MVRKMTTGLLVLVLATPLLLLSSTADAATRIYFEDFESNGWESAFSSGTQNANITTSNPRSGTRCIRGNLSPVGSTDCRDATIRCTRNPALECRFDGIESNTPNGVYVSYWLRLDAANYLYGFEGKIAYYAHDSADVVAYFSVGTAQYSTNTLSVSSNNPPWSQDWAFTNWGTAGRRGNLSPKKIDTDGNWYHVEHYFNYDTNKLKIWVDGQYPSDYSGTYIWPSDGIDIPSDFHLRGFQFWHGASDGSFSDGASNNGDECVGGWQIDDIEVWDGMPDGTDPGPPTVPQNPTLGP